MKDSMPNYHYKCTVCGIEFDKIVAYECRHEVTCIRCESKVKLIFCAPQSITINESHGPMHKQIPKDIQQKMEDRALQHKQEHEVGDFVAQHGIDKAIKKNYYNKDKKRVV